jgi:hypothetical protein
MAISVEKLPDEPIVLVRITNPLDVSRDIPYLIQELERIFDASPEQLFDITDTIGLNVSFGELVAGMAALTKGKSNVLRHPKVSGYAIVADSGLVQLGVSALGQVQYGNISAKVVTTLDEAFVVAREALKKHGAAHS